MLSAIARQDAINQTLREQLANLDDASKQSRMMAFMMKNPEKAEKLMKAMAEMGTDAAQAGTTQAERRAAFQAEFKTLVTNYLANTPRAR